MVDLSNFAIYSGFLLYEYCNKDNLGVYRAALLLPITHCSCKTNAIRIWDSKFVVFLFVYYCLCPLLLVGWRPY